LAILLEGAPPAPDVLVLFQRAAPKTWVQSRRRLYTTPSREGGMEIPARLMEELSNGTDGLVVAAHDVGLPHLSHRPAVSSERIYH
jgi:hypothetical protein